MKVPMISTKAHVYAGKMRTVGSHYDATSEVDAKLMVTLGRARRAIGAENPIHVPTEAIPTEAISAPRVKRQYRRRDLTAEA